jgi:hypothetical protein
MNENLILSGADQDLFGHYCRLEDLRDGAGSKFDVALHEQLELLKMNPFLGPTYPRLPRIRRLAALALSIHEPSAANAGKPASASLGLL